MKAVFRRWLTLAVLTAAVICLAVFTGCEIRTYNMIDPGRPSETFKAFYRAVSDGDDAAANELLGNYSWNGCAPEKTGDNTYTVNGMELTGSDATLLECLLRSRKCVVVSESDYTRDDKTATVTVKYTSFDISAFQKALAARAVEEVKARRYLGEVYKDSSDTGALIEKLKAELLKNPSDYYTTRKYRISLTGAKGKWKVMLTEDFYKALSGYTE